MSNETNENCAVDEGIQKLLEQIAEEEGFLEYKVANIGNSVKGDGYNGIVRSTTIVGKDVENENKTLNLVIKSASKSDVFRSEMPVASIFQREIYVYDTVFPTFRAFELEKGPPPSSFAPKLYKSSVTHKSEAVVMENLKESGYKLYQRKRAMDDGHVNLVMVQYGRFHAISFALQDQRPEKIAELSEPFDDMFASVVKKTFLNTLMHRYDTILKSLDPIADQKAVKRFKKFVDDTEEFLDEIEELACSYCAILHGDCWTNNMMFKYEDPSNPTKPTQMRFLDFQVSKVGPPVLDLAYFFYVCSSKEIINNLSHYMQVYYDSLSSHLRKLGSDPGKIYPYSVLQQQWKKFGKFGLLTAAFLLHVMLSDTDEAVDLKDAADSGVGVSEALNYSIANTEEYNDRMRHIILHLVGHDFI